MNPNEIICNLLGVFSPLITFFLLKILNFRAERVVCEFYVALQEKNPRSYVRQSKLVKVVRKYSGMFTDGKVHWVHCFGNYLQFVAIVFPIVLFLFCLLLDISGIVFKIFNFCIIVIILWSLMISVFTVFLCFICKKIKKNNLKYSKCELREW